MKIKVIVATKKKTTQGSRSDGDIHCVWALD
jgi:hypothetical protein